MSDNHLLHARGGVSLAVAKFKLLSDLLHARGGVSLKVNKRLRRQRSSPRTWRCFLFFIFILIICSNLLHARGGVSPIVGLLPEPTGSSPRTWRCFSQLLGQCSGGEIFSTHVEVFLYFQFRRRHFVNLLHARGGVSRSCNEASQCD